MEKQHDQALDMPEVRPRPLRVDSSSGNYSTVRSGVCLVEAGPEFKLRFGLQLLVARIDEGLGWI